MRDNGRKMTAIVLAAGLSSRMSALKPLLPIHGKPALYQVLDRIFNAGIEECVVVSGHEFSRVEEAVKTYVQTQSRLVSIAHNPDYEKGMITSVQAGIRFVIHQGGNDVLLHPVDIPLVASQTIRAVAAAAEMEGHRNSFIVPCFQGRNGHPLFIPSSAFDSILRFEGEGGLRAIRDANPETIVRIETDDEGCILDMDTPE
ncbi:MAG: nucleotidyltransferase family protein, partial [Clostridiales Family XIII bacterium]|nr:nucleotidyltransferase family protein [Clostridiales Family XIII bacterium]